jgi:hypothetical protein
MGKADIILTIGALSILLLGSITTLYVTQTQAATTTITINNQTYTIDQLFSQTTPRTFTDQNATGIALDALITNAGITNPETHQYIIIGADGYQKTVTWDNLQHGLLTRQRQVVFSDLAKAFNVKNLVKIEVKQ